MKDDLESMLKKIICYWLVVAFTLGTLVYFIFPKYTFVFIIGLIIALSNFIISTIIIKVVLKKHNGKNALIVSISFTLRIIIVCIIGLKLFAYNKFNVIAYMCGFCSYFICLVLYAVDIKNQ